MSSELIETERTSAGSLLTTRQQRLLPLQLFCPWVAFAGRGCSRSNLRSCSLHHGREEANKGNRAGTGTTEAPPQSIPLGQKENLTKPNPKRESMPQFQARRSKADLGCLCKEKLRTAAILGVAPQGSSTCRSLPKVQIGRVHQTTHPTPSLHFAHFTTH